MIRSHHLGTDHGGQGFDEERASILGDGAETGLRIAGQRQLAGHQDVEFGMEPKGDVKADFHAAAGNGRISGLSFRYGFRLRRA